MPPSSSLYDILKNSSQSAGFELFGALDLESVNLTPYHEKYRKWLERGFAGEMSYLFRGEERRQDPRILFPTAQSVIAVGLTYSAEAYGETNPEKGVRYARYLRGGDYHRRIPELLESALRLAEKRFGAKLSYKICVDTSALLERTWAALAGLGWIGKNSMLIHPQHGSYFLLGFALLDRKVERGPALLKDYCGECTRCLTACPTGAFVEPRKLDSNRCISYWTLEKRGELALTDSDAKAIGNWVAGCDLCQEACPFNTKPSRRPTLTASTSPLPTDWNSLIGETEQQYRERTRDNALNHVKPAEFRRNLEIVRKNFLR